jgi:hypothetical protein
MSLRQSTNSRQHRVFLFLVFLECVHGFRRRVIKSVANATIRCLATILCRWHSVANNPSYKATPLQLTYEDSSVTGINPGVGFQYTVSPDMVAKTSKRHVLGIHQSISVESSWLSVLDNSDRVQPRIVLIIASSSLKKRHQNTAY